METSILTQNVQGGTATRSAIDCPTAAKTGTTERTVDAWLDGYTPNYSTAVWMGYPNKRVSMTDVHGEPQQGGYLPAEIWHAYMAAVTEGQPCVPFPEPRKPISYPPFYGKFASTGEAQRRPGQPPNAGIPRRSHRTSTPERAARWRRRSQRRQRARTSRAARRGRRRPSQHGAEPATGRARATPGGAARRRSQASPRAAALVV